MLRTGPAGPERRYCAAAFCSLAREIEDHLQALPAGRWAQGPVAGAASCWPMPPATAQAVRTAVLRVTRSARAARWRATSASAIRSPPASRAHIARALTRILVRVETHRRVCARHRVLPEDVHTMQDLARDLGRHRRRPGHRVGRTGELLEAQGALRAFFDLSRPRRRWRCRDPDERARLLSLLPRAEERRHLRREPTRASG